MVLMVLTSMLMSMSILSLKLEFENVLMSMLIENPALKSGTLERLERTVLVVRYVSRNLGSIFWTF